MKELFEKKRIEAEKALKEKMGNAVKNKMVASQAEIDERKAKLLAQRDLLRK